MLDQAIKDLVKNGDVDVKTARHYIVGYLAKQLTEQGFWRVSELRTGSKTLQVVEVRESQRAGAA